MTERPYRSLPSVDSLAGAPEFAAAAPAAVVGAVRDAIDEARARIAHGDPAPGRDAILEDARRRLSAAAAPPLVPLVNATGVIIHTNLGRAPLAEEAIAAMREATFGYTNLEIDITSGRRGSRHALIEPMLRRLTGAEAAMVVNNNASAVLLALSALAAGKEVIISRGQLVEIGGGFRIPDVMRQSRAKLVEVGTTNRTRATDFEASVRAKTAALMRVHSSNFKIVGFTASAALEEMARVARTHAVLLLDDLGSGCLLDTTAFGLPREPTPEASIAAGADVAMFSGDKLLGGPQAGVIVGRRDAIERMTRHPLARAVRLDKASIAGLAATLRLYEEGRAIERIPVWRMIATPLESIARRARAIAEPIEGARVVDTRSMIGGGSLPDETLPSVCVALRRHGLSADRLATRLRERGIVPRIEDGLVLLDPRTIEEAHDSRVARACVEALA